MNDKQYKFGRSTWFAVFILLCMGSTYWGIRVYEKVVAFAQPEALLLVQVFFIWPLAFFLIVYPKTRKAKQVLLPLLGGMLFGSLILTDAEKYVWHYIDMLRWLVVLAFGAGELWVLLMLLRSLVRLRRTATPDNDIAKVMRRAMGDSVGTRLMTAELLMWFYALLSYGKQAYKYQGTRHFFSDRHEENASNQIAFLLIIAVETPIAHFLLAMGSPRAALVASVLSVYGFFWLLGEYRASKLRPISLDSETLYLRMGILGNEQVAVADISDVEICSERFRRRKHLLRRVPAGTQANVRITLRQPTIVQTTFGADTYTLIALAVNEPTQFVALLQSIISNLGGDRHYAEPLASRE